jgi:hypothetical protein
MFAAKTCSFDEFHKEIRKGVQMLSACDFAT